MYTGTLLEQMVRAEGSASAVQKFLFQYANPVTTRFRFI
jgi:hypothetical protein